MGLPDESDPPEVYGLSQMPTEREPVPPPDWPEGSFFQPPPHYHILEPIAGGGMGMVYKAEDTRLHRIVALKVLPPRFTNDAVAKERFLREARTASALDHQNICAIYDIGESEDGRLYISMAFYQGQTLRARLANGPLPVEEALDIARQVARGLAKAHRLGIVHRDIKPENLMITTDGVVKILDFGIAKLSGSKDLTGTEHRIGTPAYMPPEQSKSAKVDHRADLWSLGVVLYEMLTGRRPFRGANPVAVLQAIHYGVPEPISEIRHGVPARLERVVARLLMKSPQARYQDAEALLAELDGQTSSRRSRNVWLAAGIAVAAGIGILATWSLGQGDRGSARTELKVDSLKRLTDQGGGEWSPVLSPNGEKLVYSRRDGPDYDIFLQEVNGGTPVNLTPDSPEDDVEPAFSPDGNHIAYRSGTPDQGGIVLLTLGGPSRRLAGFGHSPAWSPDGESLLVAEEGVVTPIQRDVRSRIWRIDVETGESRLVVERDGVQPAWSPSGRRIAYASVFAKTGRWMLWTVDADGSNPAAVTAGNQTDWNPAWSPDGYLYFLSNRGGSAGLWRVAIDEATGRTLDEPEPVNIATARLAALSLSSDGRRLLFVSEADGASVDRVELDPEGPRVLGSPSPVTEGSLNVLHSRVSPDGRWLVFTGLDPADQEDLYLAPVDRSGPPRQLTRDEHKDRYPSWMPDGRILFSSNRGGQYRAWTVRPDSSGLRRLEVSDRAVLLNPMLSPDGRWLACAVPAAEGYPAALVDMSLPPSERVPVQLPSLGWPAFFPWSWSPDGRRLVGTRDGLLLYSPASRRYERLTSDGSYPVFLRTRPAVLFLREGRVVVLDLETRRASDLLVPPPDSYYTHLEVGPDDRTLYAVRSREEGDVWMLTLEK